MATAPSTPLQQQLAFRALDAHHGEIADAHLRDLFAADPGRGAASSRTGCGIHLDYSKHRVTDETLRLLVQLAGETGVAERRDAMSPGERINVTENRSVLHVALRMPRGEIADRGRARRRRRRPRGARPHRCVRRTDPLGRVDGPHRQVDRQRRQHRHRRLGPRAGDGLQGPAPLQARDDVPVRLERRRNRLRGGDARPRPRAHALHRLLQDVHDARDHDERRDGSRLAARCAGRGLLGRGPALRCRLDESGRGGGVRHRHGQRIRVWEWVGGRYSIDSGIGLSHDRRRPQALRRDAERLPRDGRAFPHGAGRVEPAHGDGRGRLVRRLLRRPDPGGAPIRPIPRALPGLPPAAHDGVERQVRATRLDPGRGTHRRRLLGRAGNERPAQLLPADPPGHPADPVRLRLLRAEPQPARPPPRPARRQRLRAGGGARVRADGRGGRGRGHTRSARPPTAPFPATARPAC